MPPSPVSLRKRELYIFFHEFVHVLIELINAIAMLVACWGFYTWFAIFYTAAVWIFVGTSILGMVFAINAVIEEIRHYEKLTAEEKEAQKYKVQREMLPNLIYVAGNAAFIAGSVLFLPEVFDNPGLDADNIIMWGTILFIAGSVLFTIASFFNALVIHINGQWKHHDIHKLGIISLVLNFIGGELYAIGSVLFFSYFEPPTGAAEPAWSTVDVGTHYFIAGAAFFVGGVSVHLLQVLLKHKAYASNLLSKLDKESTAAATTEITSPSRTM